MHPVLSQSSLRLGGLGNADFPKIAGQLRNDIKLVLFGTGGKIGFESAIDQVSPSAALTQQGQNSVRVDAIVLVAAGSV